MSKVTSDYMKTLIKEMIANKKERKFVETVEL